ncbi:MAG: M20/M25/M40 family metallo-hydrolase [Spirochaetales bacterium]|nr:M20/M25/M40 family metallo-hydrolase [Spirochaetales bacterium]
MKKASLCLLLAALVVPLFSQTRQERLFEHVYYFASDSLHGRAAGSEDAAKAAAYIVNEYESMGLKPLYEDWYMPFKSNGNAYKNVVAVLEGNDPELKDQYIVLGAHYDHLGIKKGEIYNGADDNASGSAALIEIARALCANRDRLKRTVVIAAFDAEELGLYGSNALASRMLEEDSLDVRLMMSIDMVGWYKASGNLILEGVATIKNGRKVLQSEKINLKFKNFEWSPVTATDTEGFARKQIPTLAVSTGMKSPYHKPEDDADLIDYEGLDKVSEYLTDLTLEVASDKGFSSSGRVARKHMDGHPIIETGLSLNVGSSHFEFPEAAFEGKTGFSYGAGLSAQLNFNHHSHWALKAEAIYARTSAMYPDVADTYSSALKYTGDELFVPVQFLFQGRSMQNLFLGFGGYYNHKFKTSLPVDQTIISDNYGLAAEWGFKLGGFGMSVIWMSSLTPFFEGAASPSVKQSTALFRINKYF